MNAFADQLLVLVLLINFLVLGTSRVNVAIRAVALQGIALGLLPALMHRFSWHLVLIAAGMVIVGVVGWRAALEFTSRAIGPRERLLLVGTNPAAVALARELHEHRVPVDPRRLRPGVVIHCRSAGSHRVRLVELPGQRPAVVIFPTPVRFYRISQAIRLEKLGGADHRFGPEWPACADES